MAVPAEFNVTVGDDGKAPVTDATVGKLGFAEIKLPSF